MNDPRSVPPAVTSALAPLAPDERERLMSVWRLVQRNSTVPDDSALDEREAAAVVRGRLQKMAKAQGSASAGAAGRPLRDRPPRRSRWLHYGWGATVVAMLALIVVGGIWLTQPNEVIPPDGQTLRLTLPDGTRVALDAGARLSYPRWFGLWDRTVSLNGTAFFAVDPGSESFVVGTSNARVTVLGTRFEVQGSLEGPGATTVTVEEGRVRLAARHNEGDSVILGGGQQSTLPAGAMVPTPLASVDVNAATWRLRSISFVDQPLFQIVETLEAQYNLEIRVEENALQEQRRMTYIAQRPVPVQTVLADLCRTLNLQFRRTADGYEIFRAS